MEDDDTHPMDSPAPIILGVALIATLVLGALMITDIVWQIGGPMTLASTSMPAPKASPPQPAPP